VLVDSAGRTPEAAAIPLAEARDRPYGESFVVWVGVVVVGLELVVGWLAAWAWGKARRVAGRADAEVDRALDAGMDRLHELVSGKLGDDPALARLEDEAGQDLEAVSASPRTRQRVELALAEAVESDTDFAARLAELVAQLRQAGVASPEVTTVTAANTGPAVATRGGVAVSGAVGGDVSTGTTQ
jgi:hypothetical protein